MFTPGAVDMEADLKELRICREARVVVSVAVDEPAVLYFAREPYPLLV
jgi:hypothetical protein